MLLYGYFCKLRFCPICQWRKAIRWQEQFIASLPDILAIYPTSHWLTLTLTVRNCPIQDLSETIDDMNAAWCRLMKYKEMQSALGWIRVTEISKPDDENAHPHFHCLLMVPSSWKSHHYLTHHRLRELWKKALKANYLPNTHIEYVSPTKKEIAQYGYQESRIKKIIDKASGVFRYALKSVDMTDNDEWFFELNWQVWRKRFVASGGTLKRSISEERRKRKKKESKDDEEFDFAEGEPVENADFTAKWSSMGQCYYGE